MVLRCTTARTCGETMTPGFSLVLFVGSRAGTACRSVSLLRQEQERLLRPAGWPACLPCLPGSPRPCAAESFLRYVWQVSYGGRDSGYFDSLRQDANLTNSPCAAAQDVITRPQLSKLNSCHAPLQRPELELLDSTGILVERPSLWRSGTSYGQLARTLTIIWEGEIDRLLAGRLAD